MPHFQPSQCAALRALPASAIPPADRTPQPAGGTGTSPPQRDPPACRISASSDSIGRPRASPTGATSATGDVIIENPSSVRLVERMFDTLTRRLGQLPAHELVHQQGRPRDPVHRHADEDRRDRRRPSPLRDFEQVSRERVRGTRTELSPSPAPSSPRGRGRGGGPRRSRPSRAPPCDTTDLPSWCTSSMSFVAFSREYPNSFWNTYTTYVMQVHRVVPHDDHPRPVRSRRARRGPARRPGRAPRSSRPSTRAPTSRRR